MSWDASAQAFDQLHQSTVWKSLFQQFITFAAPEASDVTLEIGAKTGRLSLALAAKTREVQGLENDPQMLALAEKNVRTARVDNISFESGDIEDLPFADGSFDLTCAFMVLYKSPDPTKAFRELARVTRTGGKIICLNPSPLLTKEAAEKMIKKTMPPKSLSDALLALADEANKTKRFTEDDLADLFGAAGIYEVELDAALDELFFLAKARRT